MTDVLLRSYGSLLVVRPPPPVTFNRAGKNYKSEVAHLEYSPRRAYDEWLAICAAIVACGGDAVFEFEADDQPFLDRGDLEITADGTIRPRGSAEVLGHADAILTGRVFTANGPWCTIAGGTLRVVMPRMLDHRRAELPYFAQLFEKLAAAAGLDLELLDNPYRWEGMADVAVIGELVILSHTMAGRYDRGVEAKTLRSTRAGGDFAADALGVPAEARLHAELVYPHFHGDTVQFAARLPSGSGSGSGSGSDADFTTAVLVQYPGGLWPGDAERIAAAIAPGRVIAIARADAVDAYAANSRQVGRGILLPDHASASFVDTLAALGLGCHRLALDELFAKAGGGPACATLVLPADLTLPADHSLRYSVRGAELLARRTRIPDRLTVDAAYFAGQVRG